MTYCLGIKVKDGLVAISDSRISTGVNITVKKKLFIEQKDSFSLFLMTSGLRSVTDKAICYFKELVQEGVGFNKLFKAVNAFSDQIKRVALEDGSAFQMAGLKFNMNTIIGGQLRDDKEHMLFWLQPEGTWIEINGDSPYIIIGNARHGKAILNKLLDKNTSMEQALKAAYISFDSTRSSGNDVDFPIDAVLYKKDSFSIVEHQFTEKDMEQTTKLWNKKLKESLDELPNDWVDAAFEKLPRADHQFKLSSTTTQ
jgi:putative proteasome-type protease